MQTYIDLQWKKTSWKTYWQKEMFRNKELSSE